MEQMVVGSNPGAGTFVLGKNYIYFMNVFTAILNSGYNVE